MANIIPSELREIRRSLELLEAAFFHLAELVEARQSPMLLSKVRAARLLGVGPQTMRTLVKTGRVGVVRLEARELVPRSELERLARAALTFQASPRRRLVRRPRSVDELRSPESRAVKVRRKRMLEREGQAAGGAPPESSLEF